MPPLPPLNGPPPPSPYAIGFKHGPPELCQLALDWERRRPLPSPDWVLEEKFDGIRLLWIGGDLRTREGEPFEAAEHLRETFERLERRAGKPMFFDGEFGTPNGFLDSLAAFRRGADNKAGGVRLFDGFPLEQWRDGKSKLTQEGRRRILESIFDEWKPEGVRLVDQWPAPWAPANVLINAEAIWANGGEGLMVKHRHRHYERARNGHWLKIKRSLRLRCTVLEILKDGAAVRVEYQGCKLRVAVPPPLRGNAKPSIVGTSVMVEAMEFTEKGSLRQGRVESFGDE